MAFAGFAQTSQANNPGFSAPSTHPFGAFNQQVAQPAPYTGLNISQPIGFTSSLAPNLQAPDGIPSLAITNSTKFNDLPPILQDLLNDVENLVQSGSNIAKDLNAREFGQEIVNNAATGRQIFHDLSATTNTLVSDYLFAKDLRNKIDQAVQDVIIASRIIDGFKDAQQNLHLKNHAQFPLEFFSRITEQMAERIQRYRVIMEQVERKLESSFQTQQPPQAIAAALQSQNASFMALSVQVAEVHSELEALKAKFKARLGGTRDPFARVA